MEHFIYMYNDVGDRIGMLYSLKFSECYSDDRLIREWQSKTLMQVQGDPKLSVIWDVMPDLINNVIHSVTQIADVTKLDRQDAVTFRGCTWLVNPTQLDELGTFGSPVELSEVSFDARLINVSSPAAQQFLNMELLLAAVKKVSRSISCK